MLPANVYMPLACPLVALVTWEVACLQLPWAYGVDYMTAFVVESLELSSLGHSPIEGFIDKLLDILYLHLLKYVVYCHHWL